MALKFERLDLPGLVLIEPQKYSDERGFFSETYNANAYSKFGCHDDFVQDNHSLSVKTGTVRGLHFQAPPHAQCKLVRVIKGAILDIAVDIRTQSATFGQHVAVELSAQNWRQLLVPEGFAHGFCTTEPDTEVIYKVNGLYNPQSEGGILWNDKSLGIAWPAFAGSEVSQKDSVLPAFAELKSPFCAPVAER